METKIQVYTYNGQDIEFALANDNVMVNATEMAKPFGKKMNDFLSNKDTKAFINECLKSGNSRFISANSEKDLVRSSQKSGTWMHRVLALKFAAWLNPTFELWIYSTIEKVLYASLREIENSNRKKAVLIKELRTLEKELMVENPKFTEFQKKQTQLRQLSYQIGKANNNQLQMMLE